MNKWTNFLDALPNKNSIFIVKFDPNLALDDSFNDVKSFLYIAVRHEFDTIWVIEDLCDDNVIGMQWKIDWDLGGFKWSYINNVHESYLKFIQPERSKREDLDCNNCKGIPRIFMCCYIHKNDESCDEYKFKMRCSEHCGNIIK